MNTEIDREDERDLELARNLFYSFMAWLHRTTFDLTVKEMKKDLGADFKVGELWQGFAERMIDEMSTVGAEDAETEENSMAPALRNIH